jgi:hypothetical protein
MTYLRSIGLTGLACVLIGASSAAAQPLEMKRPPSRPEKVAPSAPDRDLRPAQPAVPYEPAFIPGLSTTTRTGRAGAAGWTAPNSPTGARGAADPESSGVAGFGFAAEWGAPTPPPATQ